MLHFIGQSVLLVLQVDLVVSAAVIFYVSVCFMPIGAGTTVHAIYPYVGVVTCKRFQRFT